MYEDRQTGLKCFEMEGERERGVTFQLAPDKMALRDDDDVNEDVNDDVDLKESIIFIALDEKDKG